MPAKSGDDDTYIEGRSTRVDTAVPAIEAFRDRWQNGVYAHDPFPYPYSTASEQDGNAFLLG
jgi:hypothetical protein